MKEYFVLIDYKCEDGNVRLSGKRKAENSEQVIQTLFMDFKKLGFPLNREEIKLTELG